MQSMRLTKEIVPFIGFLNIIEEGCFGRRLVFLSVDMLGLVGFTRRLADRLLEEKVRVERVFMSRTLSPPERYVLEMDICITGREDGEKLRIIENTVSDIVDKWGEREGIIDHYVLHPFKNKLVYNPYQKGYAFKWGEKGVLLPIHELEGLIINLIREYGVELATTLLGKLGLNIGEKKLGVLEDLARKWAPSIAVETFLIMLHSEGWLSLQSFSTRRRNGKEIVRAYASSSIEEEILARNGVKSCGVLTTSMIRGFLENMARKWGISKEDITVEEKKCLYRDGAVLYEIAVPEV